LISKLKDILHLFEERLETIHVKQPSASVKPVTQNSFKPCVLFNPENSLEIKGIVPNLRASPLK
jgi:hypothetical protein